MWVIAGKLAGKMDWPILVIKGLEYLKLEYILWHLSKSSFQIFSLLLFCEKVLISFDTPGTNMKYPKNINILDEAGCLQWSPGDLGLHLVTKQYSLNILIIMNLIY